MQNNSWFLSQSTCNFTFMINDNLDLLVKLDHDDSHHSDSDEEVVHCNINESNLPKRILNQLQQDGAGIKRTVTEMLGIDDLSIFKEKVEIG